MKKSNVTLFAVYFGVLPNYFEFWLASCGKNINFNWVFITDQCIDSMNIPSNVVVFREDFAEFIKFFEKRLDIKVDWPIDPYKLCDFKPVYYLLLEKYNIEADFWGHCDLDLIFGDLKKFLSENVLSAYDRIYSEGHLSIYRNSKFVNEVYRIPCKDLDWKRILESKKIHGFDEHNGVNLIWKSLDLRFLKRSAAIDVHPGFSGLYDVNPFNILFRQCYKYENGKILQVGVGVFGVKIVREYCYMHFQKRHVVIDGVDSQADIFYLNGGFSREKEKRKYMYISMNGRKSILHACEIMDFLKNIYRYIRNLAKGK